MVSPPTPLEPGMVDPAVMTPSTQTTVISPQTQPGVVSQPAVVRVAGMSPPPQPAVVGAAGMSPPPQPAVVGAARMSPPPQAAVVRAAGMSSRHHQDQSDDYDEREIDLDLESGRTSSLTGEMWTVTLQCKGSNSMNREFIQVELDRAGMSYLNLIRLRGKLGYSSRSYMFYKKRVSNDLASLVLIDYESDAETMIKDNERERKVRLLLTRDEPSNMQVSITPLKRPREMTNNKHRRREDPIDAYKDWLSDLQAKAREQRAEDEQEDVDGQDKDVDGQDKPHPEYRNDYRNETIKTYTEWLRLRRELSDIVQYVPEEEEADGVRTPTPPQDENDESNPSPMKWPSHARRPKKRTKGGKKGGRGSLKGIAAAIKRIKNGTPKLHIEFSVSKKGPIGSNARTFVNDVVYYSRKRTPLIGVRSWKDIKQKVKNSIVNDILNKWTFPNNINAKEKILDIAAERYKGWRSTFSSTYKAYNSYDARMRNKPEDVDIVEWHYLMLYFGTDEFQKLSQTNSNNRKKQKVLHLMGSNSYSQFSYEQRDPETGQEPSDLSLFKMTHCKNGAWIDRESMNIYEDASSKVIKTELTENRLMQPEEENIVFEESYKKITGCKTSKPPAQGYLAKYPTRRQLLNAQIEAAARASAAAEERNNELEARAQDLQQQLADQAAKHATEVAEREKNFEERMRQVQEEEKKAREALSDQLMAQMTAMLEKQREEATQKANQERVMPSENIPVRKTGTSKVLPKTSAYISPHQLRNTANKSRSRPREDAI